MFTARERERKKEGGRLAWRNPDERGEGVKSRPDWANKIPRQHFLPSQIEKCKKFVEKNHIFALFSSSLFSNSGVGIVQKNGGRGGGGGGDRNPLCPLYTVHVISILLFIKRVIWTYLRHSTNITQAHIADFRGFPAGSRTALGERYTLYLL